MKTFNTVVAGILLAIALTGCGGGGGSTGRTTQGTTSGATSGGGTTSGATTSGGTNGGTTKPPVVVDKSYWQETKPDGSAQPFPYDTNGSDYKSGGSVSAPSLKIPSPPPASFVGHWKGSFNEPATSTQGGQSGAVDMTIATDGTASGTFTGHSVQFDGTTGPDFTTNINAGGIDGDSFLLIAPYSNTGNGTYWRGPVTVSGSTLSGNIQAGSTSTQFDGSGNLVITSISVASATVTLAKQ